MCLSELRHEYFRTSPENGVEWTGWLSLRRPQATASCNSALAQDLAQYLSVAAATAVVPSRECMLQASLRVMRRR